METSTQIEDAAIERPKDNRKLIVIACLTIAIFGIGAFQFVGMSGSAPNSSSKKADKAKAKSERDSDPPVSTEDEIKKQLVAQLVSGVLPRRDPFQQLVNPTPDQPVTPPKEDVHEPPQAPRVPRTKGNQGYREVPPWDPKIEGSLPPAGKSGKGEIGVEKSAPLRQPNEFAYTLTGVIVGEKSMCVFQNDAGNQFLVPVGGSLDGDSRITKISRGEVTVRHRGKDVTLKIGGH